MSIGSAVESFFVARAPRKDSPHTTAAYRRDLVAVSRLVAERVGRDPVVADLRAVVLREAFAVFAADRSAASVSRAWSVWHTFCEFLVAEDVLPGNPMSGVARPRRPDRVPKPLQGDRTPEELLRAVAAGVRRARDPWPERDLAVLAVLLLTGLRSAELLALRVSSVVGRPGERRLSVRGKGDRFRSVPVEESLFAVVEAYLSSRRGRFGARSVAGSQPLFVDTAGSGLTRSQLRYLVEQCYRHAGVRDRVQRGALVHALRHTFATRLAEDGASITEIARLLGHSSVVTSEWYIESTGAAQRAAAGANRTYRVLSELGSEQAG
ncbi:tyrosine-type recombinase/integrase [Actinocatenispora rupis]|uniref:Integrase n=1 Tax=Actinocatenispora rupis TaxID=519421 RepID=A0A8J3IZ14_9ACTN|nr:tyrosine-type recombinase/integrase [Actinocatenispora rupis]GID12656.1 integrase [Actinocatenispora rupis]